MSSTINPSVGVGSGPPAKKKKKPHPVMSSLYDQLGNGNTADVVFLAGPPGPSHQKTKLPAHKNVLMGVSKVFATRMEDRWEAGDTFELPSEYSVPSVKTFIKGIYLELDDEDVGDIGWEGVLDVLKLAEMYGVEHLIEQASQLIATMVNEENAYQVWASCRLMREPGVAMLTKKCLGIIINSPIDEENAYSIWASIRFMDEPEIVRLTKKCLNIIINTLTSCSEHWDYFLLRQVLDGNDIGDFPEDEILTKLLEWRDKEGERKNEFRLLWKFIRFPLIEHNRLLTILKPYPDLLTSEELIDLCHYSLGLDGALRKGRNPEFSRKPRNNRKKIARNSNELVKILKIARPGDLITLLEGTYIGNFATPVDKLYIQGAGKNYTKIVMTKPSCLKISGHYVTIKDLSIEIQIPENSSRLSFSSNTILKNLSFKNCCVALKDFSLGENLQVSFTDLGPNRANSCVELVGGGNTLSEVEVNNCATGLLIEGSGNSVEHISCNDIYRGVVVSGGKNNVSNLTYSVPNIMGSEGNPPILTAIDVVGGSDNVFTNCNSVGKGCNTYSLLFHKGFINSKIASYPKNNVFTNCGPGNVKVVGENNKFFNVDCAQGLTVLGRGPQYFENCRANTVNKSLGCGACETVQCNFKFY